MFYGLGLVAPILEPVLCLEESGTTRALGESPRRQQYPFLTLLAAFRSHWLFNS